MNNSVLVLPKQRPNSNHLPATPGEVIEFPAPLSEVEATRMHGECMVLLRRLSDEDIPLALHYLRIVAGGAR